MSQCWPTMKAGAMARLRADHVADHHAQSEASRLVGDQQRLGEAAALVELDVDDVEAAD